MSFPGSCVNARTHTHTLIFLSLMAHVFALAVSKPWLKQRAQTGSHHRAGVQVHGLELHGLVNETHTLNMKHDSCGEGSKRKKQQRNLTNPSELWVAVGSRAAAGSVEVMEEGMCFSHCPRNTHTHARACGVNNEAVPDPAVFTGCSVPHCGLIIGQTKHHNIYCVILLSWNLQTIPKPWCLSTIIVINIKSCVKGLIGYWGLKM